MSDAPAPWPDLDYESWEDTLATLHLWTQVVGKVRLERSPWRNHSWHVPLYVTSRGLGSSPIPAGDRSFEIDFDFRRHRLVVHTSEGLERDMKLEPRSVKSFHAELMSILDGLALSTPIHTVPSEIPDGIPFDQDETHASYDAERVHLFWQTLVRADLVLRDFQARFRGKSSPVHFFWGSFDLAVTRFSGREAPEHPAGIPALPDWVAREAYSHEVHSVGFWPGGPVFPKPVFYAYAYPSPEGFSTAEVGPEAAFWTDDLREWVLPYEAVRTADDPARALLTFAESSYEAVAELADWDRGALEWPDGANGPPQAAR